MQKKHRLRPGKRTSRDHFWGQENGSMQNVAHAQKPVGDTETDRRCFCILFLGRQKSFPRILFSVFRGHYWWQPQDKLCFQKVGQTALQNTQTTSHDSLFWETRSQGQNHMFGRQRTISGCMFSPHVALLHGYFGSSPEGKSMTVCCEEKLKRLVLMKGVCIPQYSCQKENHVCFYMFSRTKMKKWAKRTERFWNKAQQGFFNLIAAVHRWVPPYPNAYVNQNWPLSEVFSKPHLNPCCVILHA